MPKCEIENIQNLSKSKHNPVIVNFQNAIPMEEENRIRFVVDKDQNEGVMIDYEGEINTSYYGKIGKGYPNHLISTYLAIRNKNTNKIRMIEVEECSVLSHHYYKKPSQSGSMPIDAKSLLYKNFGSKSAIRAMDRIEKTEFNADILKDKLDTAVKDVVETSLIEEVAEGDDICPKKNKEANKLEDVYKLHDIIPEEILACLEQPAMSMLETKLIRLPITSPFLLSCIKNVQMSKEPDSPSNIQKLKICLYMDALVNLINSKVRLMSKIEISKSSQKLEQHIRHTFSPDTKSLIKTKYSKQKALCHFLVLAFFLTNDFQINVINLTEGLNVAKSELTRFISYIGASQTIKTGTIKLKLPKDVTPGGKPYRRYKKN